MSNSDSIDAFASHPQLRAILDRGAREGRVTYQFINETLGDLPVDDEATETLYEVLEKRSIQIVDESELGGAPGQPKSAKTARPRPGKTSKDAGSTSGTIAGTAESSAGSGSEPKAAPAPRKARKDSEFGDLDDVLASLEELMNSPLGELLARDDAATEGGVDEEGESLGAPVEDSFTQYMNRMGRVPRLSEEEEARLGKLARTGSELEREDAKAKLVEANLRLVVSIAKRYVDHAALPLIDLVQEGNVGLMRAVDKWDPERGRTLGSYATWYIRESINQSIANQARAIRLPGHVGAAVQKLQRLQRELAQQLGRPPVLDEVALAAGMTPDQASEILRLIAEPISFEAPMGEDENSTLGDVLAGVDDEFSMTELSKKDLNAAVDFALENLTERERAVIEQRFGLGDYSGVGARTVDDVALNMRVSRERVRELEIRALRKMRRRTRGTVLEGLFDTGELED